MTTLASAGLFAATLVIAAGPVSAAASAPARVTPDNYHVTQVGYGATLAAAEQDAREQIISDYGGCGTMSLVGDSQLANGTWQATLYATCTAIR